MRCESRLHWIRWLSISISTSFWRSVPSGRTTSKPPPLLIEIHSPSGDHSGRGPSEASFTSSRQFVPSRLTIEIAHCSEGSSVWPRDTNASWLESGDQLGASQPHPLQ